MAPPHPGSAARIGTRLARAAGLAVACLATGALAAGAASLGLGATGPNVSVNEARVNLAGRQRMLTERTAAEVLAAAVAGDRVDREARLSAAGAAASLLAATESVLDHGGPVRDLTGQRTGTRLPTPGPDQRHQRAGLGAEVAAYTSMARSLDAALQQKAAAAELAHPTVASDGPPAPTRLDPVLVARMSRLVTDRADLVVRLDTATKAEQARAADAAALSRRTATGAVGALGVVVALGVAAVSRRRKDAARRQAVETDSRLRTVLTGSREATLLVGTDGIIRYATPAAATLGLSPADCLGVDLTELVAARDRVRARAALAACELDEVELELTGGTVVAMSLTDLTAEPSVAGLVVQLRDISDRRRVERIRALRGATLGLMRAVAAAANTSSTVNEALQSVLDDVCEHFGWKIGHALLVDSDGTHLASSGLWSTSGTGPEFDEFRQVSERMRFTIGVGLPGRVLAGREPLWVPDVTLDPNFPRAPYAVPAGLHAAAAFPLLLGDSVIAVLEFFDTQVLNTDGDVLDVMRQIGQHLARVAEREATASVLQHQAETDEVTGLLNRAAFQLALAQWRAEGGPLTVLYIDLDDFKDVNDMLGHAAGDELLRHVGTTLRQASRGTDVVARVGGDEFAILTSCPPIATEQLAERVLGALEQAVLVGQGSVLVRASIGLATAVDECTDLLVEADLALYAAKARGKSCWVRFDSTLADELRSRTELDERLRSALDDGDFEVHYQPVVEAVSGQVVSCEALLRWPGSGLGPADFVPRLESTGLVVPVGWWVLETACRQAAAWRDAGLSRTVAVNVSPRQIATAGFEHEVAEVLLACGLPPELLVLEVTETAADGLAVDVLARVSALGVRIAIDDFGTGYSSMARLRIMPTDTIKIDRSFIWELGTSAGADALVRSMVDLAHALDLRVVAEGVETADQRDLLIAMRCDLLQGYLLGRPVPAHELDLVKV